MPLPNDFNASEHLQTTLRRVFNPIIREEFSDVSDDPDLGVSRSSLRQACLLDDDDTNEMMLLRLFLFYFGLGKLDELIPVYYGIPAAGYMAVRKYKPHVTIVFRESLIDARQEGRYPTYGEISFRLMDKDTESVTRAELNILANKIKTEFSTRSQSIWRKGKNMATYKDVENGFDFQLAVRSKQDGKDMVIKILSITNKVPDWKFFNYKVNEEPTQAYPETPPTIRVLGKFKKAPRIRKNCDLYFYRSHIKLWGEPKPITLYENTVDPSTLVN